MILLVAGRVTCSTSCLSWGIYGKNRLVCSMGNLW